MKMLLKREQTAGRLGKGVQFKLWAKLEVDEQEQALITRYKFDQSILIADAEPQLIKKSAFLGFIACIVVYLIIAMILPTGVALALAVVAWAGVGYWYYNEKREKLFVKDLLNGRHFTCDGIIALTQKEAWLNSMSVVLRQVIETAKHWGGTETNDIPVLNREEAKQLVASLG